MNLSKNQIKFNWAIFFTAIYLFVGFSGNAQTGGAVYEKGPAMKRAKLYPTSVLLNNGKIMSFGGREYNFVSGAYAELYDPVAKSFTEMPMNFPHDGFATVKLTDGRYFLIGGSHDLGVAPGYSSTEMYNPATNTFDTKASMTKARMQLGAAQLKNGKVLIAGAWYNPSGAQTGEIYDTSANTFDATGNLNQSRANPIVIATNDGGAVVVGGWPTYGGSIYTNVEYYRANTNDYVVQSTQIIPSDSGWLLSPIYSRPITDSRMNDGRYLLLASRSNPASEFALLVFNPETKLFSKFATNKPLKDAFTDGGFFDLVLDNTHNLAYIMGVDSGYIPQRLCLLTVNLANGNVYHPGSTYIMPDGEYLYPTFTYLPAQDQILVQGVNGSNNSYFTGTDKTYLLTPKYALDVKQSVGTSAMQASVYPNPASDVLNIDIKLQNPQNIEISLVDLQGKMVAGKCAFVNSNHVQMPINVGHLPSGFYQLRIITSESIIHKTIVITR